MARLANLQRKIDEATKEVRHLAQDDHDRRPQHRKLHQEGSFNEDECTMILIMVPLLLIMLLP
jgi:hypothetical protein